MYDRFQTLHEKISYLLHFRQFKRVYTFICDTCFDKAFLVSPLFGALAVVGTGAEHRDCNSSCVSSFWG